MLEDVVVCTSQSNDCMCVYIPQNSTRRCHLCSSVCLHISSQRCIRIQVCIHNIASGVYQQRRSPKRLIFFWLSTPSLFVAELIGNSFSMRSCTSICFLPHLDACMVDVFQRRVAAFRAWLQARPETCIAVVSHWGVLAELTGHQFENCELATFVLDAEQPLGEKLRYWTP